MFSRLSCIRSESRRDFMVTTRVGLYLSPRYRIVDTRLPIGLSFDCIFRSGNNALSLKANVVVRARAEAKNQFTRENKAAVCAGRSRVMMSRARRKISAFVLSATAMPPGIVLRCVSRPYDSLSLSRARACAVWIGRLHRSISPTASARARALDACR